LQHGKHAKTFSAKDNICCSLVADHIVIAPPAFVAQVVITFPWSLTITTASFTVIMKRPTPHTLAIATDRLIQAMPRVADDLREQSLATSSAFNCIRAFARLLALPPPFAASNFAIY
jgi:hypothetical protein